MPADLEKIPTWIAVVAVALSDGAGRWLMHRRPPHKQHGGLWEFPGGKVDPGETPRAALVREVNEELGLTLSPDQLRPAAFADSSGARDGAGIVILLYTAPVPAGEASALEGGEIGWFAPEEARTLAMPPLDVELVRQLFGD